MAGRPRKTDIDGRHENMHGWSADKRKLMILEMIAEAENSKRTDVLDDALMMYIESRRPEEAAEIYEELSRKYKDKADYIRNTYLPEFRQRQRAYGEALIRRFVFYKMKTRLCNKEDVDEFIHKQLCKELAMTTDDAYTLWNDVVAKIKEEVGSGETRPYHIDDADDRLCEKYVNGEL